jgi:hypothetical protein
MHFRRPSDGQTGVSWLTSAALVLLLGVGTCGTASAQAPQRNDNARKPAPKPTPAVDELKQVLDLLERQGMFEADDLRRLLETVGNDDIEEFLIQNARILRELQDAAGMARPGFVGAGPAFAPAPIPRPTPGVRGQSMESRLGARLAPPTPTLRDQLDLPAGQGIVLEDVMADSPAAKAGLKSHDILLELDGKPAPEDAATFSRDLNAIPADKAVDVVVLRRGKRESLKGLKLAAVRIPRPTVERLPGPFAPVIPQVGFADGAPPRIPVGALGNNGAKIANVKTMNFRNDTEFSSRREENGVIIVIRGPIEDGAAVVAEITIDDGVELRKYSSADKVPEQYRDKVEKLIKTATKRNARIEKNAVDAPAPKRD